MSVCARECVCVVCLKHEPLALDIRRAIENGAKITTNIIFIILLFHGGNLFARAGEQEDQIRVVKLFVQAAYEGEEGVTHTLQSVCCCFH